MKQPENILKANEGVGADMSWVDIYDEEDMVCVGIGATKATALKAAIRRLNRLSLDAQKMLDKL